MKIILFCLSLPSVLGIPDAAAQTQMAPLQACIIIYSTNASAPITVITTSPHWFRDDYVKQESVVTNLNLTCLSASSAITRIDQDSVSLILHEVTVYGPNVIGGKYGGDLKLQRLMVREMTINLEKARPIQVNDQIYSTKSFGTKFTTIPPIGTNEN